MRYLWGCVVLVGLMLAGCESTTVQNPPTVGANATTDDAGDPAVDTSTELMTEEEKQASEIAASGDAPAGDPPPPAGTPGSEPTTAAPAATEAPTATEAPAATAGEATATPVPHADGKVALSPENTKIQFVGTHSGDKPDPRTGGFAKFTGEAVVDPASKALQSVVVDIDTTSLFTTIPDAATNKKLSDHLKSPDFFEVNEYPAAKFESTKIEAGENGQANITGNLTLHGQTKKVSFPATVQVGDDGVTLHSEFAIKRSEFGMDFGAGQVDDQVALTVVVGEPTQVPAE